MRTSTHAGRSRPRPTPAGCEPCRQLFVHAHEEAPDPALAPPAEQPPPALGRGGAAGAPVTRGGGCGGVWPAGALAAEAAVAAAEQDKDMPLLEDGATPALNFTAPPLADALLKDFEQAQVEVDIDKKHA